ncbi:inner kinetochore subunit Mif2p [[Candida] anglica]|uniref:Inner kinetochore subunit Mif2p n=1 Tax=[Candida] anglica TaxID=148631 RepID=A0ABP0EFD3_9ASCO
MDLLNLGSQARRTGLKPRENVARDRHDMEDIDEFFADEGENDFVSEQSSKPSVPRATSRASGAPVSRSITEESQTRRPRGGDFNNVARKIDFTETEAESFTLSPITFSAKGAPVKKNKKSPLRSPLPERRDVGYENNDNDNDDFDMGGLSDLDMSLSPVEIPEVVNTREEVKQRRGTGTNSSSTPKAPSLTKRMALGKSSGKRRAMPKKRQQSPPPPSSSQEDYSRSYIDDESSGEEYMDTSYKEEAAISVPSPPRKSKKRPSNKGSTPQASSYTVTNPSPLPSPPPDGLRRSRRTKIAPLAFWRNERIVYSRAHEDEIHDADSTELRFMKLAPLQEIKEVVHIPEVTTQTDRRPKHQPRHATRASSIGASTKETNIEGSEWFKDESLTLEVFNEQGGDKRTKRRIAWAPGSGNFFTPPSDANNPASRENFKLATLFDGDNNFTASGLLELPISGFKKLRHTAEHVFIFHVVQGTLEVTLNESVFVVTGGCSFEVPRGNMYGLRNVGQDTARVFFVQTKSFEDVAPGSDGEWD